MLARELQVIKISQKDDNVMIQFNSPEKISNVCVQMLIDIYKSKVFFSSGAVPYITIKLQSKKDSDILGEVNKILKIVKG